MEQIYDLKEKRVGEILTEAGLVNNGQIIVALNEQNFYTDLKIGEILVLHGWLHQETADFFGDRIKNLINNAQRKRIGEFFSEAGLISQDELNSILKEQRQLGIKFGSMAVLKGCLKQQTLEFFLKYFVSHNSRQTHFTYLDKEETKTKANKLIDKQLHDKDKSTIGDEIEIPWVD